MPDPLVWSRIHGDLVAGPYRVVRVTSWIYALMVDGVSIYTADSPLLCANEAERLWRKS